MVRNYKRTSSRKILPQAILQRAKKLVADGSTIRNAAAVLKVNECTLRKRLKDGYGSSTLGRFQPIFTAEQEEEIAQHCRDLDVRFYGLSKRALQKMVYQYAHMNKIPHPFNTTKKMAGRDWTNSFLARHKLALRTPSNTSIARVMGFNPEQVELFFDNLIEMKLKFGFQPQQILNIDECGFSTVPNTRERVVSEKGKKHVGRVVSAERGQLITVVGCVSATGQLVPPAIIFPRKNQKPELMYGAPLQSIELCSETGYMNTDLFLIWLKHFADHVRPSQDYPILLILDNHISHISLEAINFGRDNHIHMLTLPPHTSHKLQPLDVGFFGVLKDIYASECTTWMDQNPGRVITQRNFAEIFGKAYAKVMHPQYGISAFKSCGIEPYDRNVFDKDDFMPSTVTCQAQYYDSVRDSNVNELNENNQGMSVDETDSILNTGENYIISTGVEYYMNDNAEGIDTNNNVEGINTNDNAEGIDTNDNAEGNDTNGNARETTNDILLTSDNDVIFNVGKINERGSISSIENDTNVHFSPCEIVPLPVIKEPRKRSNRAGKSVVLTGTPEKKLAEDKRRIAEEKVRLVEEKRKILAEKRRLKAERNDLKTKAKVQRPKTVGKKNQNTKNREKRSVNTMPEPSNSSVIPLEPQPSTSSAFQDQSINKVSRALFAPIPQKVPEYECPACNEIYEEPPMEDWIECNVCLRWWHENCTNVVPGLFICDLCKS